jgi:hypothetical protein
MSTRLYLLEGILIFTSSINLIKLILFCVVIDPFLHIKVEYRINAAKKKEYSLLMNKVVRFF